LRLVPARMCKDLNLEARDPSQSVASTQARARKFAPALHLSSEITLMSSNNINLIRNWTDLKMAHLSAVRWRAERIRTPDLYS
jgi:hypothetical protein